jgi:hypothetical protein
MNMNNGIVRLGRCQTYGLRTRPAALDSVFSYRLQLNVQFRHRVQLPVFLYPPSYTYF